MHNKVNETITISITSSDLPTSPTPFMAGHSLGDPKTIRVIIHETNIDTKIHFRGPK